MCRVDGGISSANVVGEELDAVVVGSDMVVQVGDREVLGAIDPDGSEEGVVGLVEASEEILNEFFLIKGPTCCSKFIGEALHLGEVLRRGQVLLPRPGEGDAKVRDPRP
jgi:hypothetical protein